MNTQTETRTQTNSISEILELSKLFSNEYHVKRVHEDIELFNNIKSIYSCDILFNFGQYIDSEGELTTYYEHAQIYLKHDFLKIRITFDTYRKKYSIFAIFDHYENISSYFRRDTEEKAEQPQKIGVLTAKKISNWVNYYEGIDIIYKAENNKRADKVQVFRNSLIGLPVKWNNANNGGYMDKNGLEYSFTIETDGHITEKIRITKSRDDITRLI
jgi:hypothetical protein